MLRAGLAFAPTAVVFGLVGLTWRRWPASWQKAVIPGGFALTAVFMAAVGLVLRNGDDGGPWLYVAFAGVGVGLALGSSPTLTRALATSESRRSAHSS